MLLLDSSVVSTHLSRYDWPTIVVLDMSKHLEESNLVVLTVLSCLELVSSNSN